MTTYTLFKDIKSLEPGCYLVVTKDSVEQHVYWAPEFSASPKIDSFNEAIPAFQQVLKKSVNRHLMSDVPVAAYLSAGFDSTAVSAQASNFLKQPPKTFTGRFPQGGWYDEYAGASMVAEKIGSEHCAVDITPEMAMSALDEVVLALDAPQMGMGALPQYLVAKTAAQDRKVILTGHGGDELFSGYPVFKFAALSSAFKQGPGALLMALQRVRKSEIPHLAYFTWNSIKAGEGSYFLPVLFSRKQQMQALHSEVWQQLAPNNPALRLQNIKDQSANIYEMILRNYLQLYLPGLLAVEDKISMAHSLESRTPLLDNEMIELSMSLSADIKLRNGELKAIIKEGVRDLLPAALYKMPKRGFPTPLGKWLRGPMSDWMQRRIVSDNSSLNRLFRKEWLQQYVATYQTSPRRIWRPLDEIGSHQMWMLMCLESWLRQTEERWNIRLEM